MDRKDLFTAILLSVAVFGGWMLYQAWYIKHHPQPQVTETPAATQPAVAETSTTNPATSPSGTTSAPVVSSGIHVVPSSQPVVGAIYLGSDAKDDATYAMQLVLTPNGAGVREV